MSVELPDEAAVVLRDVPTARPGDQPIEIAATSDPAFRQRLRNRRHALRVHARLSPAPADR
jgi:hypothetical protein